MTNTPPRAPGVTIGDVAAAAGVSQATVSRAFHRPEMLRENTVERVRAVAAKLGYVGNQAARALVTGRFGNIAVVVPDIANPFFPPLVRAIQGRADALGFEVFLGDSDESAAREATLMTRLSPQVDGFVLAAPRLEEARLHELSRLRPLVLVNRDIATIPRVLIDPAGGITEAIVHLQQLGHRDVAYLSGPRESWSDQQRRAALEESAAQFGVRVRVIELGRPTHEAGRDAVSAIVTSGVTAAIAFDDVVAQGVLAGLQLRGIQVPSDFSLVGCDDTLAAGTTPALTTISAAAGHAGAAAAELLIATLDGTERPEEQVGIATHLVVRASTGRAVDAS